MPIYITILIIINVLIFLAQMFTTGPTGSPITTGFARDNAAINNGEYYRLLTSAFLHGSIMHLFFNMYSLSALGPTVAGVFRKNGFLFIYFLSALGGSVASYLVAQMTQNYTISVGASGAIFGLIGALLAYSIYSKNSYFLKQIVMIILINLAIGFTPNSGIDNWAHLGGLATGFILGMVLPKKMDEYI